MLVVGLDLGFGNTKRAVGRVTEGIPQLDTWPACAVPAHSMGCDLLGETLSDQEVTIDGEVWRVGVDPEQVGTAGEILHDGYVGSAPWRAQMLYALNGYRRIGRLVLGLPMDEWQSSEAQERASASAMELARSAKIAIDDVMVIPQPLGAYIDANARASGSLVDRRVLVVDPGRYTVDWTLFVGGRLREEGTGSDRQGAVSRIVEGTTKHLREAYGAKVDEGRVRKSLEAGGKIMVRGQDIDCSEAIARISAQVVDNTIGIIRRTLRIESDIDTVVLAGGGAVFYQDRLNALFGPSLVHVVPGPVEANVRGYWWYGAHSR